LQEICDRLHEVWFTRGGYLYKVATEKDPHSWLAGIMKI